MGLPAHQTHTIKKVAIIANRWCASSTEGFILEALQNKKVRLFGENTAGMISYGDWMKVDAPCLPVNLTIATKKEHLAGNADYESIGIAPALKLDEAHEENWITEVQKNLEK